VTTQVRGGQKKKSWGVVHLGKKKKKHLGEGGGEQKGVLQSKGKKGGSCRWGYTYSQVGRIGTLGGGNEENVWEKPVGHHLGSKKGVKEQKKNPEEEEREENKIGGDLKRGRTTGQDGEKCRKKKKVSVKRGGKGTYKKHPTACVQNYLQFPKDMVATMVTNEKFTKKSGGFGKRTG